MNASELQLELSPSVEAAKRESPDKPVSAGTFALAILQVGDHAKEYAGGLFLKLPPRNTERVLPVQQWIEEAQTLFVPERMRPPSDPSQPKQLHGRLMIIALALLDPELREQLESSGAFDALLKELWQPLTEYLSDRGRALLGSKDAEFSASSVSEVSETSVGVKSDQPATTSNGKPFVQPTPPPDELFDTVPIWNDDALGKKEQDLLGRWAFARFLARLINTVSSASGAYPIHIYGPWGAGKSTLLNFLKAELETNEEKDEQEKPKWIVVEFNAWRNQHMRPPWWSLMDEVFRQTKSQMSWRDKLREYSWRLAPGRMQYVFAVILLFWVMALIFFPTISRLANATSTADFWAPIAGLADDISKILALLATVWGIVLAANRTLLFGSAKAAQDYTERGQDPMNTIKDRFNCLIKCLPCRVAVFIDDLDRCKSDYVVELLEGIQTLFREAPVVFVVAADKRWLDACYTDVYLKLEPHVRESGKPLGTLFLEKAFRFSTPMPGIPDELRSDYWNFLLRLKREDANAAIENARKSARDRLSAAKSEGDIRAIVNQEESRDSSFVERRAIREEAVVQLATREVVGQIEHTLKPYSVLLEPNPRAMKRLVNMYACNRALSMLSRQDIALHQLALWTVLSSRWPKLADYLLEHPDRLGLIGKPDVDIEDDVLEPLFSSDSVIDVAKGGPVPEPLMAATLRACARMSA